MRTRILTALLLLAVGFTAWSLVNAFKTESAPGLPHADRPERARRNRAAHPERPAFIPPELRSAPDSDSESDASVRVYVSSGEYVSEGLRQLLAELGGREITWLNDGSYSVFLPQKTAELLGRHLTVSPAGPPMSQALLNRISTLPPNEWIKVTFIVRDLSVRERLLRELANRGRVVSAVDCALIGELSRDSLLAVVSAEKDNLLAVDLNLEAQLTEDTAGSGEAPPAARNLLFTGRDERIAMMDTGCSAGKTALGSEAFHPDLSDRIDAILPQPWWALHSKLSPSDGTDALGHGTAVAGIIVGTGKSSPTRQPQALAPEAKLLVQNNAFTGEARLMVPPDLRPVFAEANDFGARIHTNSWGHPRQETAYSLEAWAADTFAWEHPDFLILFAAGNHGPGKGTLSGGAALAKNVLTVGALTADGSAPAPFSSRGPTADGRLKPEVLAAGTQVISTAPPPDHGYVLANGTSMAAPGAAAALALIRQWVREVHGIASPSAALLKALLYLGCTPVETAPETFGAVNPANTLLPKNARLRFSDFTYRASGAEEFFDFTVTEPGPLTAILTWTDAPADIGAVDTRVNLLKLRLEDAAGSILPCGLLDTGTAVRLHAPHLLPGDYRLTVTSHRVPQPDGSAALAVRLPDSGTTLLHAPVRTLEPGASAPVLFAAEGPEDEAILLETSVDGETWETEKQNHRLDAPGKPSAFFYRLATASRLWGPYAVQVARSVPVTLRDGERTETRLLPAGSDTTLELPVLTRWEVTRAGYPLITRHTAPVLRWKLTDEASGRTLARGEGSSATFTCPDAPAVLELIR